MFYSPSFVLLKQYIIVIWFFGINVTWQLSLLAAELGVL
jgi:hypothetical protein